MANDTQSTFTLAKPLAKCGVLYLGSAVPKRDTVGIDSVQEPLSKRYLTNNKNSVYGIDALLIIRENGAELVFNQDKSAALFYPIRSLLYCASVRFATVSRDGHIPTYRFVPLDSTVAKLSENLSHPPIFCAVFKRTKNVPGEECHCFVTKTKESAMALVQACFTAYNSTGRFQDINKVPLYIRNEGNQSYESSNAVRVIEAPTSVSVVDFMTSQKSVGFFYTTNNVTIDTWQLWEEEKSINPSNSTSSETSDEESTFDDQFSDSNDQDSTFSYDSSTEYYHGRNDVIIPESLNSAFRGKYGPIDPYEPAPNLIKVEHKKDPVTGADIFVRWFKPNTPKPRKKEKMNQKHPVVIVQERQISNDMPNPPVREILYNAKSNPKKREGNNSKDSLIYDIIHVEPPELKSILRKSSKNNKKHSQNSFYITEAFFEDTKGKRHSIDKKKLKKFVQQYRPKEYEDGLEKSLIPRRYHSLRDDKLKRSFSSGSLVRGTLPIGARIPRVHERLTHSYEPKTHHAVKKRSEKKEHWRYISDDRPNYLRDLNYRNFNDYDYLKASHGYNRSSQNSNYSHRNRRRRNV